MTDIAPRLPCPVCLGVTMERLRMGSKGALLVDHCRRCGGLWLEHGEVQQLRKLPIAELRKQVKGRPEPFSMRCHDCFAPLSRGDSECASCGWKNILDCPDCARPMSVESHAGLRLDVCRSCKGIWFDQHELETIWSSSFDLALQRRNLSRRDALGSAAEATGDVLFNALFFAPDLVYMGGYAAANAAAASIEVARALPGAISAAPEVAASAFEAVGEAAGSVFEIILGIIADLFG